jgi:hypothetical protein
MATTTTDEDLVRAGLRHRGQSLVQQAGYTLGLAAADADGLTELLPEGFLAQAEALRREVDVAYQDRAIVAEEAKSATKAQDDQARAAKLWRRRVSARAKRARRLGATLPDALLYIAQTRSLPALLNQLTSWVGLMRTSHEALGLAGDPTKLIDEGALLIEALRTKDDEQELKRLDALPASVRAFHLAKGRLYIALKVIHDAGQELWSAEPSMAARYNLAILYRSGRRPKAAVEAPPTSPAPAPADEPA